MLIKETVKSASEIKTVADMFLSLLALSSCVHWDEHEFLLESAINFLNWIYEEVDFKINYEV